MIELKNISLSFEEKSVLKDFSLSLPDSGCICFWGASGRGKSTLFNLLCGLIKPQSGSISGTENKSFSCVFQSPRLLPWLNALDNISIVKANSEPNARRLLKLLDLENEAKAFPHELSGGMKQRVSIARALNFNGDILLLDEPMTGLDAEMSSRAWELIRKQYQQRLIIFSTHNRGEAEARADRIIEL